MKSRLSPFAKLVDNTVFINSNSMCDNVKGYYGIITFHGNNSGNPKQNIRVDFNILKWINKYIFKYSLLLWWLLWILISWIIFIGFNNTMD